MTNGIPGDTGSVGSQIYVDDLLLYSKCPMRYFFKTYIGLTGSVTSVTSQVSDIIRSAIISYMSNYGASNAYSIASRKLNDALSSIVVDTTVRGSKRKQRIVDASISNAAAILERAVRELEYMDLTDVVSPYIYKVSIDSDTTLVGAIDAVYKHNGSTYLMYIDASLMTHSDISDDYLDNHLHITINAFAYEQQEGSSPYKLVHYFPYTNTMLPVYRTSSQVQNVRHELISMYTALATSVDKSAWYRSKGFWCNICGIKVACNELFSASAFRSAHG